MAKRLVKSADKKVSGVLAGIANYMDIDPTVARLAFILLTFLTGLVPGIIAYVIISLVIPNE